MFEKLKQIKDLRSQAKTMQSVLATESVTAEKGGVTVTLNGNLEVTAFAIGDGMNKAQIEKASLEAVNDAIKKASILKQASDSSLNFKLSVSKAKTFEDCKAKYKFSYIEKLPKKDWDFHVFGKFLHAILEEFHLQLMFGRPRQRMRRNLSCRIERNF
jgi:DNA-binding protein YbaB